MFKAIAQAFQSEAQGWQIIEIEAETKTIDGEAVSLVRDGKGYSAISDYVEPGTYAIRKSEWAKVAFHEGGDRGAKDRKQGRKEGYKLRLDFSKR